MRRGGRQPPFRRRLPMRRFLIGGGGIAEGFTLGLAFGQKLRQAQQAIQIFALPRHHVGQVVDRADQMRHPFFHCV